MRDPRPFENDPADDAAEAYEGLIDALSRLRLHEEAGLPLADSADEVAEMGVRMIDLVSAILDDAGIHDAETRIGAINVLRESLAEYVTPTAIDQPADEDYEDDRVGRDALTAFVAGRMGRVLVSAHPLGLPSLSFAGPADPALRN